MTQEQYIAQNALGFEGDRLLKGKFEQVIKDKNISWVIETGTYFGATTKKLADMVKRVDTIEIMRENEPKINENLKGLENVKVHFGNSPEVLKGILDGLPKKGRRPNTFFFLDAHWQEYNPLLDELKVIASSGMKPVIAIHDFKVPEHPELGYDTYKDITYEWEWITKDIEGIYGVDGYALEYNTEAEGAKRGVVFIYPKK